MLKSVNINFAWMLDTLLNNGRFSSLCCILYRNTHLLCTVVSMLTCTLIYVKTLYLPLLVQLSPWNWFGRQQQSPSVDSHTALSFRVADLNSFTIVRLNETKFPCHHFVFWRDRGVLENRITRVKFRDFFFSRINNFISTASNDSYMTLCNIHSLDPCIPVILDQVTSYSHITDFNAVMQSILISIDSGCKNRCAQQLQQLQLHAAKRPASHS